MDPKNLPVYKEREKILQKLKSHRVVVVESPTGSGKTTQLPQILYNNGFNSGGIIGVTQPRRIAAVSVSGFIAKQMKKIIPDTIGYKMRFADETDQSTKIKVMTDGILLQEIKADYYLSKYSAIIVDEAHERSLNIDFSIGLLKRVLDERPDFKIIISSATINAQVFSEYFHGCPIVNIESIIYPVDVVYRPPEIEKNFDSILARIEEILISINKENIPGDILIFLSGEKAIKLCISMIENLPFSKNYKILPLYSRLSSAEQEKVFQTFDRMRKVIIATNIAETSVTIDGISIVIDSGYAKMNFYNTKTFTSSLVEIPISKASCNQRKGRAGRTQAGTCFRLYTQKDYESRAMFTIEEIFRTDLSEVVLRMAEIGIKDFENFDFISSPSKQVIISAIETLKMLDALDNERKLSEIGKMMALFPMLPRHSRIIVEAIRKYPKITEEVLIATSFLSTNSPFLLPHGLELEARKAQHIFRDKRGDFMSYLKIFRAISNTRKKENFCQNHFLDYKAMAEILNVKSQLEEILTENGIPILSGGSTKEYLCSIARGLIQYVCVQSSKGNYRSLTAGKITIHPGSVMFRKNPRFIVAGEIVKTSRIYARSVSELKSEWFSEISPLLDKLLYFKNKSFKATKGRRDFTNNIKIGYEIFKIDSNKGKKKCVILPWEKLKNTLKDIDTAYLSNFRNIRGKIIYKNYEILSGLPLNTILALAPKINLEGEILLKWPRKTFFLKENHRYLLRLFHLLLKLCKKNKKSRKCGFLALLTNSKGEYWFKPIRNFYSAVSESLSSLEAIADEVNSILKKEEKEKINLIYRKLSTLFNQ